MVLRLIKINRKTAPMVFEHVGFLPQPDDFSRQLLIVMRSSPLRSGGW
jgi:hypothetical protein